MSIVNREHAVCIGFYGEYVRLSSAIESTKKGYNERRI